jgi:DNA-binding transcriptional LysR family regulator
MSSALDALGRQELDAAFGRPHDLDHPWPEALTRRPVCLEPLAAAVVEGHPLADAPVVSPGDLRETGLWWPLVGSPAELVGFIQRYGEEHRIPVDLSGPNLGLDRFLVDLLRTPERVTLIGTEWPLPPDTSVRRIPIDPAPSYLWHIVWRAVHLHPVVGRLIDFLTETGSQEGWLDPGDHRTWVPQTDRADLRRQPPNPGSARG